MWFRKNVAGPERWARVIVGLMLIGFGLVGLPGSWLGWLAASMGGVGVLTALVGFCPACALAGRQPRAGR